MQRTLLLFTACVFLSALAIPMRGQDTSAVRLSDRVTYDLSAEGFILRGDNTNPYYHGSGLLHTVHTFTIDEYVQVPFRIAAEAASYSARYGADQNLELWGKVALKARIPVDAFWLDSLNVHAGDLWRQSHGRGLALDYFEAQGIVIDMHFGDFLLQGRGMGVGWYYVDDIRTLSLRYADYVGVHALFNYTGGIRLEEGTNLAAIVSADFNVPVWNGIELYGEAGTNVQEGDGFGMMAGVKYSWAGEATVISTYAEYRHYDADFFRMGRYTDGRFAEDRIFPFVSLTGLDKPYNHYLTYQSYLIDQSEARSGYLASQQLDPIDVAILHVYARRDIIWRLFLEADVSVFLGTLDNTPYEVYAGIEAIDGVDFKLGVMNRFPFAATAPDNPDTVHWIDVRNGVSGILLATFRF